MQILYGKDTALVEQEARKLFPAARFIRAGKDLAQTLQNACSSSLLSEAGKCIVADCDFLTEASVSKNDKAAVAMMADLDLSQLVLLATGDKLTSEATVSRVVLKKAKAKRIAPLNERTLSARIAAEAKERGFALSDGAVALMVQRLPANWGVVSSELEKIQNLGKKEIGAKDIEWLVSTYSDESVLDLVDAILKGDGPRALSLYQATKRNGVDEGEMIGILASQLVFIKNAVIEFKKTPNAGAVAAALNVSAFRVSMNLDLIARTSLIRINETIDLTYHYDMLVKDGSLNKSACMQALIMETGAYVRKN